MATGYRLAVDFGTSHTVAALQGPEGIARPLVIDGPGLMPSAVLALSEGEVLVGRDAAQAAYTALSSFEPYPKRHFGDTELLLGDREVPIEELTAAVLRRVLEEAERAAGGSVSDIVLTHPAGWGSGLREKLQTAARLAGMRNVRLTPEPTAAINFFVQNEKIVVPVGGLAVVYDFGAGTFDCAIVRRTDAGFEVIATNGIDVGGLDMDEAVIQYLASVYRSRDPHSWDALTQPTTPEEFRALQQFRASVRAAKETLSRRSQTTLHIPMFGTDALLTREDLEGFASPIIARTVETLQETLRESRLQVEDIAHVVLVGGSSRVPLVATMLHRALGIKPTVLEQPELVVALGALLLEDAPAQVKPAIPLQQVGESDSVPATAVIEEADPKRRKRRRWVSWTAAVSIIMLMAGLVFWQMDWYGLGKPPNWIDLKGHTQPASMAKYSADGRFLVSIAPDDRVIKWDADTGEMLWSHDYPDDASLDDVAITADGSWIAVNISNDETTRGVAILEGNSGSHNRSLTTDQALVMAMCGDRFAFTVGDSLKLVPPGDWDNVSTVKLDGASINWFACNAAGTQVAATLGATLTGFDVANNRKLWEQPLDNTGYVTHEYVVGDNKVAVLTELGLVIRDGATGVAEQDFSFGRVGLTGTTSMALATVRYDYTDIIAFSDLGTLRFMRSTALGVDVAEEIGYNEKYATGFLAFSPSGNQIALDISDQDSGVQGATPSSLSIRRVDYLN